MALKIGSADVTKLYLGSTAISKLYLGDILIQGGGVTPLSISGSPGPATVGQNYSFAPTVAGGSGTKAFTLSGSLPSGLNFTSATGAISGTPTAAGAFSGITISVSDNSGSASLPGLSIIVAADTLPTFASMTAGGDSLTRGLNASPETQGYIYLVAAAKNATIKNKGIGGSALQNSNYGGFPRTDNWRDRFIADIFGSNKSDFLSSAFGTNDERLVNDTNFNVTNFIGDYGETLAGAYLGGANKYYTPENTLLIGVPWLTDAGLGSGTRQLLAQYNAAVLAVAVEHGTLYCNIHDLMVATGDPASFIDTDGIHFPTAQHARVADLVLKNCYRPNTRQRPGNVHLTSSGSGKLDLSFDAVSGAIGYTIQNGPDCTYTFPNSKAASGPDGWTGMANGVYRARVRAEFTGGLSSPWSYAPEAVTLGVLTFFADAMIAADDSLMTAHSPEVGGPWRVFQGTGTSAKIVNNRVYFDAVGSIYIGSEADWDAGFIEADFFNVSTVSGQIQNICLHQQPIKNSCYQLRWVQTANQFRVYRLLEGTTTQLFAVASTIPVGGARKARLESSKAGILSMYLDGVFQQSFDDSANWIGPGKIAIYNGIAGTKTTGIHLTNIRSGSLAA